MAQVLLGGSVAAAGPRPACRVSWIRPVLGQPPAPLCICPGTPLSWDPWTPYLLQTPDICSSPG